MVPPAAQVRGAAGERVDPCWDPRISGRLPGITTVRLKHLARKKSSSVCWQTTWLPPGTGAVFTEGTVRTAAVRRVHGQARGQTQPVQTQTWVPMFMSFLQKLCQSRVHRAENMC